MATDRSLATLLRAFQSVSDHQDLVRLLESATTLLTVLSNPRNVSLLVSQLLCAPAIWHVPDQLETAVHVSNIFSSVLSRKLKGHNSGSAHGGIFAYNTLPISQWIEAIKQGTDEHTPQWKHILILAGLLRGLKQQDSHTWQSQCNKLSFQMVTAINAFLHNPSIHDDLATQSITVVLSSVFSLFDQYVRAKIDYDRLLPLLCHETLFGKNGLHAGYFLSRIDNDVVQAADKLFRWPSTSASFIHFRAMSASPVLSHLGPLSSLIAYSAANVGDIGLVRDLMSDLLRFSRSANLQWRHNKLSEIDAREDVSFLTEDSLQQTLPLLWQVLRTSSFAVIVILRSAMDRALLDTQVSSEVATEVACQTLRVLRHLYFVSTRLKINSSSQYSYVYLTSIDILALAPSQAQALFEELMPVSLGSIPPHPLDRYDDLFFLNTAEHFSSVLAPKIGENLFVAAAQPYLESDGDQRLCALFEAAHSVILSVFAAPHNTAVFEQYFSSYCDSLFKVFPVALSPRQFRLAIKTLVRLTAPPAPISATKPWLPATLMELIRWRLQCPSPPPPSSNNAGQNVGQVPNTKDQPALTDQAVYEMAMIDALPFLPLDEVLEWLCITADCLGSITAEDQVKLCRARYWEMISSGELDLEHSAICITWWTTQGGREKVLQGDISNSRTAMMSGALLEKSKL